ncbi:hypothetical protein [Pseudorhodoplanes sp.]|uniref:hypothetical protein n=1 Tax=Pseudorhodoplanes sp. TaxID=1934341 RepID=UPI00391AD807
MKFSLAITGALAGVLVAAGPALAQFKTPEAAVESLYAIYTKQGSDGFSDRDAPRFLDAQTLKLWRAARHKDSDFFIQGQDFELKDVSVAPARIAGDKAETVVTFRNFGEPMRITYVFVQAKDGWRITDARSSSGTLRAALKRASKP